METLKPILEQHAFLRGLPSLYLDLIVGCAQNVRFEADEFIFREGEEANQFYIIRDGKVALEIFSPERGPMIIDTLETGDILGWSWLVPPYQWRFDARVMKAAKAIALDGKCLRTKCEEHHDLGYELLKRFADIMAQRLDAARLQLMDVYGTKS
jgi:CRP-like cAMP-binding protein